MYYNELGWFDIDASVFEVHGCNFYLGKRVQVRSITVEVVRAFTSCDLSKDYIREDLIRYLLTNYVRIINKDGTTETGMHIFKHDMLRVLLFVRDYSNFGEPLRTEEDCGGVNVNVDITPDVFVFDPIDERILDTYSDYGFDVKTIHGTKRVELLRYVDTPEAEDQITTFLRKKIGLHKQYVQCTCERCLEAVEPSKYRLPDELLGDILHSFAYKDTDSLSEDEYRLTQHRSGITMGYINTMEYWRFRQYTKILADDIEREVKQRKEEQRKQEEQNKGNNMGSYMNKLRKTMPNR